jgi:hypothetical protein
MIWEVRSNFSMTVDALLLANICCSIDLYAPARPAWAMVTDLSVLAVCPQYRARQGNLLASKLYNN